MGPVGENGRKLESLYTAGRNIRWHSCCGKTVWYFLKKLNIKLSWPSNSSPKYIPKEMKRSIPTKNLYINIHRCIIDESKSGNPNVQQWMDEQNVVYPYNGILFSHEKEWSIDTCYSMDESWKHANWKKPDTKGHILYHSIYKKCPK